MYQREVDVDMLNAVECVDFLFLILIFLRVDYGLGGSLYSVRAH